MDTIYTQCLSNHRIVKVTLTDLRKACSSLDICLGSPMTFMMSYLCTFEAILLGLPLLSKFITVLSFPIGDDNDSHSGSL